MADSPILPRDDGAFVPTDDDIESVLAWFAEYDACAAEARIERMADMALFPINVVTHDAEGNGSVESWDRELFLERMGEVVGGADEVSMESSRTPHFLSENLAFVITDATIMIGGRGHVVRYGDLLVKSGGRWVFQTMVQGGWA
jgi:hypothetical protein